MLDFGATGDGTTYDTAAIQAAIDTAEAGQAVIFPHTGAVEWYKITSTLTITITITNLRLVVQPRDGYAVSIRASGITMLEVKAPVLVMQDIAKIGDGGTNGVGATTDGAVFYGDTDGNIDANQRGETLQGLRVAVQTRGRNFIVNGK